VRRRKYPGAYFIVNDVTPSHPADETATHGHVLVVEPDLEMAEKIWAALQEAAPGAEVDVAPTIAQAQGLLLQTRPNLFVLDADAVPDLGQEFLYDLRTSHPNARAILLTGGHGAYREQAAGLGAIHFLEKPFPHGDFVDLAQALFSHAGVADSEKFQGTLSDLHLADIIQLKCMSGASAVLQFTGPKGEKARVYFEGGQVRHATAPGKEGVPAFNEIVSWKGGQISEVSGGGPFPRTITDDWQMLLMEAVRQMDETRDQPTSAGDKRKSSTRKVLVIDDSLMLLSFVKEILSEANCEVTTAATAEEGLRAATSDTPDLILLDYILPDMKGDEVCLRLCDNAATASVPIVYMSGFGTDLQPDHIKSPSVIGSLNKPFTSDLLIKTVENYMPKDPNESAEPQNESTAQEQPFSSEESTWTAPAWTQETALSQPDVSQPVWPQEPAPVEPDASQPIWSEPDVQPAAPSGETAEIASAAGAASEAWWSAPVTASTWGSQPASAPSSFQPPTTPTSIEERLPVTGAFFSGDTSFFSLNGALHTIGKEKLTGTLRSFWNNATVDLLARNGAIVLVTTRDPVLYCPEAPITLVNVDAEQTEKGRAEQRETGCPLFLTLARDGLILQEPAVQLVQHYGQKLFAQLWTAKKIRFVFEQSETLPEFCSDVPAEEDIDHWILTTLRCIQFGELGDTPEIESGSVPAYTRDGYERVQNLRLTVAEAQFASQFNGVRSVAQIAKNLRLDFKFARLTLFRFLALEIVECWPPAAAAVKPEKRGFFQKFGFGE
jgi:DNA-binding response OmpR family regulator